MKLIDFDAVPTIQGAFYLHFTMHLYFLDACNEEANICCDFIDCTEAKLGGAIDDLKAMYEVMESHIPTINIVSPLDKGSYQLLWYTTILKINRKLSLKPLQVWISEPNDELFVVHPDQSGIPKNKIRILAADYHITKPKLLYYDVV